VGLSACLSVCLSMCLSVCLSVCHALYIHIHCCRCVPVDYNECTEGADCHVNAQCTDTEGSYTCTCLSGYVGDGITSCLRKLKSSLGTQAILCSRVHRLYSVAGYTGYTL